MIGITGGVLCAGNLTQDVLVRPVEQLVFDTTTWVDDAVLSIGGNAANTSFAMARLGGRVRVIGRLGRDDFGDRVGAFLGAGGVDTSALGRSDLPTAMTVVLVRSDAARAFLYRPGASREECAVDFEKLAVEGWSHFHLANAFSLPWMRGRAAELPKAARAAGLTTSFDAGWDGRGEWLTMLEDALPYIDLFFANEDEARMLTGEEDPRCAARFLRDRGVASVVIKLGPRGCAVFFESSEIWASAFPIEPVDTTGAGDCFTGAFLTGLQRGLTLPEATRLANAAGALSATRLGSVAGLLSYDETMRWMDRSLISLPNAPPA